MIIIPIPIRITIISFNDFFLKINNHVIQKKIIIPIWYLDTKDKPKKIPHKSKYFFLLFEIILLALSSKEMAINKNDILKFTLEVLAWKKGKNQKNNNVNVKIYFAELVKKIFWFFLITIMIDKKPNNDENILKTKDQSKGSNILIKINNFINEK